MRRSLTLVVMHLTESGHLRLDVAHQIRVWKSQLLSQQRGDVKASILMIQMIACREHVRRVQEVLLELSTGRNECLDVRAHGPPRPFLSQKVVHSMHCRVVDCREAAPPRSNFTPFMREARVRALTLRPQCLPPLSGISLRSHTRTFRRPFFTPPVAMPLFVPGSKRRDWYRSRRRVSWANAPLTLDTPP